MRRKLLASIVLVLLLFTARGLAQTSDDGQPDETLPGFTSSSVFHSSGVDNVNLFSGDPGIVIPLGPAYTLSPGYTWQLKAYNSSKFWHFDTQGNCKNPDNSEKIRHAMIHGYPTLGAGWTLDPGYVGPAGVGLSPYHSPDGGQMRVRGLEAARLRMTTYSTGGTSNCSSFPCTTVEFPDGSTQVFDHAYRRQKASGTPSPDFTDEVRWVDDTIRYGLSKIIDRFGHIVLTVTWDATYPFEFTQFILYADQSVTINLTWQPKQVGGSAWRTVQSIAFPMTGGQTQTVAFGYDTGHGSIQRNSYDTSWDGSTTQCPNPWFTAVPYLTRIDFMSGTTTLATYQSTPCFDNNYCQSPDFYGTVQKLRLPTGGSLSYKYGGTTGLCEGLVGVGGNCADPELAPGTGPLRPLSGCPPGSDPNEKFGDFSAAAYQRDELDASGNTISTIGYYRYDYVPRDTTNCAAPALTDAITRQVVVTENSGDGSTFKTNHLFHVAYFRGFSTDADDGGREIERRYFAKGVPVSGTPVRTIINCLTTGSTEGSGICGYRFMRDTEIAHINAYHLMGEVREQRSVTWYADNPTTDDGSTCDINHSTPCSESANTLWDDPAKRYRTTTLSTPQAMTSWTSRATTTNWNAQTGGRWILDIFTSKLVTDGGSSIPSPSSVSTDYTIDTNTGYLQSFSTQDPTYGTLTHNFLSTLPDSNGYPTSRILSGSGTGLSGSFTDNWSFARNGMLSSQRTGVSWKSFDVDRDTNTGLITVSRDPNPSLVTRHSYDALGRLTCIKPPPADTPDSRCENPNGDAPTAVSYDSTTQTTLRRSGSDGNATWQRYLYDDLGRLIREIRQMPSGYGVRTHGYDTAGHASFVSEWGTCTSAAGDCLTATPAGTTSSNFDPFGRPQTITRADGSQTMIDRTDGAILFSDSLESVTVNVGVGSSTTRTRRDALGRIVTVAEPDVGHGPEDTTYSYNALDKLATVTQGTQTRTFVYDALGFLRSEQTPEKGRVTYIQYDALGNVLTETEAGGLVVGRTYDFAGRLTGVISGGLRYLTNCYDGQACDDGSPGYFGGLHPAGRPTRRIAFNPLSSSAPRITDDLAYSDPAGRLSSQTTTITGGDNLSTTQQWQFNALGLVAHHYHPRPGGAAPFVVSTNYDAGLPTTEYVNGLPLVTGITHHASGTVASYRTGLGIGHDVTTTISQDTASQLARPSRIFATAEGVPSPAFDTQIYAYDGAGNIVAMGPDRFGYDLRSRLTSATLSGFGSQGFSYDRYGNLLSKGSTTYSVSASTNRILTATYDARGNLTGNGGETYDYDGLDRQIRHTAGSSVWNYLFDGADERLVKIPPSPGSWTYTLRDESKRIVSEFAAATQSRDNVFLGHLLVASYANGSVGGNDRVWTFYSSDHLATPRLVTDITALTLETPRNWPFGENATTAGLFQRIRFASMERDSEASRYYDHARNHEFNLGRFLTPDLAPRKPYDPQTWNRYIYASNNPLRYVDPNGRQSVDLNGKDPNIAYLRGQISRDQLLRLPEEQAPIAAALAMGVAAFFAPEISAAVAIRGIPFLSPLAARVADFFDTRPVLLGETMGRVETVSSRLRTGTFRTAAEHRTQMMTENLRWLQGRIDAGARIFDIGINPDRVGGRSFFFAGEVSLLVRNGYQRVFSHLMMVQDNVYKVYEWVKASQAQ